MKNKINLSDQVIMISGVSGQLGQAITNEALNNKAKVIGLDQSQEEMEKVAQLYNWNKDNILFQKTDIRKKKEIENALTNGLNHFGKVTSQINNSGVSVFENWAERSEEDFDLVTDVNLKGTFFCMQAFMKHCIKSNTVGSIVNIASHYGLISPDPRIYTDCARRNSEVYGATKAGVIQMTKYFSVNALTDGANINNLRFNQLSNLPIPLPPLEEQKRIVSILDEAFEGLDRARENAEANLKNARELFDSYRDSLLNGSSLATLEDYLDNITYGFTNPMPDSDEGPYKITAKNVINRAINYQTARKTTQEAFDNLLSAKSKPAVGDVLLTKDGTLGRTAVVDRDGICINQSVAVLKPRDGLLPQYLNEILNTRTNHAAMIGDAGGATIKHLSRSLRAISSLISNPAMMVLPAPGSSASKKRRGCLGSISP